MPGYLTSIIAQATAGSTGLPRLRPTMRMGSPIAQLDQRLGMPDWDAPTPIPQASPFDPGPSIDHSEAGADDNAPRAARAGVRHQRPPAGSISTQRPESVSNVSAERREEPQAPIKKTRRTRSHDATKGVPDPIAPPAAISPASTSSRPVTANPSGDPAPSESTQTTPSPALTMRREDQSPPSRQHDAPANASVSVPGRQRASKGPARPRRQEAHTQSPAPATDARAPEDHDRPDRPLISPPSPAQRREPSSESAAFVSPPVVPTKVVPESPRVVIDRLEIEIVPPATRPAKETKRPAASERAQRNASISRIGPLRDPMAATRTFALRY